MDYTVIKKVIDRIVASFNGGGLKHYVEKKMKRFSETVNTEPQKATKMIRYTK